MSSDLLSNKDDDDVVDERVVAKAALDAAEEHLRSLCASHASTFVSVERRGAKLEALLKKLQTSITHVVDHQVTSTQASLQEETLQDLSESHRLRRRTLLQHSSLLELLELPSLMDACVRSNLYQEALSIAQFSNSLQRRQGQNVVVARVVSQIHSRQADLKQHLVGRLKHSVTMPECLEIVTSLRRLAFITSSQDSNQDKEEVLLQLEFLEARNVWLEAALRGDSFFDSIEQYRARVFEICTQFNAIFRSSSSLLGMWTTRRIHLFLNMLQNYEFTDSASLRDAWEACVFFATSMGRLGADFSPLLGKLFLEKMRLLITSHWKEGLAMLQETLSTCRDAGVASPLVSTVEVVSSHSMDGQPPRILLTLPPLARLVNAFLVGLNELRRCLFCDLHTILREACVEFLKETQVLLESNERAVRAPGLRGEATQLRQVATKMLEVFETTVKPYLQGALELALGNIHAAKVLLETKQEEEEKEEQEEEANNKDEDPASPATDPGDNESEQVESEQVETHHLKSRRRHLL